MWMWPLHCASPSHQVHGVVALQTPSFIALEALQVAFRCRMFLYWVHLAVRRASSCGRKIVQIPGRPTLYGAKVRHMQPTPLREVLSRYIARQTAKPRDGVDKQLK